MPCWKQTGLQLGKYLDLSLGSCSKEPCALPLVELVLTRWSLSILFHLAGCVKSRAKKEQSQKATGSSKEASNQSTRWLRVTQFLTNASGCHRLTWEFSWAEFWRGFWGMGAWCTGATPVPSCLLQRTSRLLQHPGCETTTPPQQKKKASGDEWINPERGTDRKGVQSGGVDETEFKWNNYDRFDHPDWLFRTFIQNRWHLCREKEDVPWQTKQNFLCANIPNGKKKNGTCGSHHISCLNPL